MSNKLIEEYIKEHGEVYISITGLSINKWWQIVFFIRHAIPSMMQAKKTDGVLLVKTKDIGNVKHTLSVWKSKKDMLAYTYSGAHAIAIKHFSSFATGKTYGYTSNVIPQWEEVSKIYHEKGRAFSKNESTLR